MRLSIYVPDDIADDVKIEQNKKGGMNISKLFQEAFKNRKGPDSNFNLLKEIQQLKRKIKRIRKIASQDNSKPIKE